MNKTRAVSNFQKFVAVQAQYGGGSLSLFSFVMLFKHPPKKKSRAHK